MNFEEILKTLKEYYANALIVQYNGKQKASATIKKLVDLVYANLALLRTEYAFDWKTAVREQLDIIGQWVGVNRVYNIPSMANKVLLSYPESNKLVPDDITTSAQFGYANYPTDAYIVGTEFEIGWLSLTAGGTALVPVIGHFYKIKTEGEYLDKIYYWTVIDEVGRYIEVPVGGVLRYPDLKGLDSQLGDEDFRQLIGMKIIYNSIPHTVGAIDKAIWEYFGARNLYYLPPLSLDTMLYADSKLKEEVGQVYKFDTFTIGQAEQGEWKQSDGLSFGSSDPKLRFINGKYIVLSNHAVYYSDNLTNWTNATVSLHHNLVDIFYINNLYYAYDNYGNYFTSSTMERFTWSQATAMHSNITRLSKIVEGNGKYVAIVNTQAGISISDDGINWSEPIPNPVAGYDNLYFANDRFFLCDEDTTLSSYDGVNWEEVQYPSNVRIGLSGGVAYGNGLYVGIGQFTEQYGDNHGDCFATSKDGISWDCFVPIDFFTGEGDLIFANNQFICAQSSYDDVNLYTSVDGISWELTNTIQGDFRNFVYIPRNKILGLIHYDGMEDDSYIISSDITYDELDLTSYSVVLPQESTDTVQSMTVGNVYTTWDIPQTVTYHYPQQLSELMNICLYKNILPAPIGTEILLTEIQEN